MPVRFLFFFAPIIIASTSLAQVKTSQESASPPEAYLILARSLADPHLTRLDSAKTERNLAQTISANRKILHELFAVAAMSEQRDLTAIANESAEAVLDLLIQLKLLDALPKPPEADQLVAEGLIRLLFRGFGIIGRVEEIYLQDTNLKNAFRALSEASARRDRAKLKLPVIAAYYSGPPAPISAPPLAIDYDAAWFPDQPDRVILRNKTGTTLHHCTILVELLGKAGTSTPTLYFVETFAPENAIYGEYAGDTKVQDKIMKRPAVQLVQGLKVSLWADELSQENIAYQYAGAEREKDIARCLNGMSITSRYRPFTRGLFVDTQRGLQVWLRGGELARPFKIIAQFHRGTKGKVMEWTFAGWKKDEQKTLDTLAGDLPWDPEWYQLEIYFPEIDYKWADKQKIRL